MLQDCSSAFNYSVSEARCSNSAEKVGTRVQRGQGKGRAKAKGQSDPSDLSPHAHLVGHQSTKAPNGQHQGSSSTPVPSPLASFPHTWLMSRTTTPPRQPTWEINDVASHPLSHRVAWRGQGHCSAEVVKRFLWTPIHMALIMPIFNFHVQCS